MKEVMERVKQKESQLKNNTQQAQLKRSIERK
ncbi:hypothetical protein FHS09_000536 [Microbulbifer rhizosphaerae]|uniref:Uncharacterized protein n=1 Tax=Microbulbifer rhizosphaerae TaxID=1562603 RepID=A0A7W4Z7G9_9GAMM|nr:hypothetical protein [Microbulbifer rhizosphaerae]